MKKVKLITGKGNDLVTYVLIPDFKQDPECVMWSMRAFFKTVEPDVYREGLLIMTNMIAPAVEGIKINKPLPPAGDDKYLSGLPNTLEDAVDDFITYFGTEKDMGVIADYTHDKFMAYAHHGAGQFIRNNWYLWWYEGHEAATWPKTQPPLNKYFNELGITHADDMSSIIISCAYRQIHSQSFEIEKLVDRFKAYWKKQGFEDGIFNNHKK